MVAGKGLSTGRICARLGIALLVLGTDVSAALAQSFNCHSARFPDELAICQDSELSRLDERVAGLYHSARSQAQGGVRQAPDKAQTDWIRARRACGPDKGCIQEAYQARIRALGQYVQSSPVSPRFGESYSDPFAYCRAVGTIDEPDQRYTGPPKPQAFWRAFDMNGSSGLLEWRCMDHTVYACASGNSPICGKMSPNDNIAAIRQFCREEPNAIGIPAAVTGRFPINWSCRQGKPVVKQGDFRVDKQGYPVEYWKMMYGGG
jgi:uncharacterized protein